MEYYLDPRILPCKHTFCYQCLLNLVCSSTVSHKCPMCRKKIVENVESLPENLIAANIAEFLKNEIVIEKKMTANELFQKGRRILEGNAVNDTEGILYLQSAVGGGNTEAEVYLADYLFDVEKYEDAKRFYEDVMTNGNAATQETLRAIIRLAEMYRRGLGVSKDLEKCMDYLKMCESDSKDSGLEGERLFQISNVHIERAEYTEAFTFLCASAYTTEHGESQNLLGWMYERGLGTAQSYRVMHLLYEKAAEMKVVAAIMNLARCYRDGIGCPVDRKHMFDFYCQAVEFKCPTAEYNLGMCYHSGIGVEKNRAKAIEYLHRAATTGVRHKGMDRAQYVLGSFYEYGIEVPMNYVTACEWYRKAAEQGHRHSQHNLGNCFRVGRGVPQDEKEAVKWLGMAVQQGCEESMNIMGTIYFDQGRRTEAVSFFEKSQRLPISQLNLGLCYLNGWGVAKDFQKAVMYFEKASSSSANLQDASYHLAKCFEEGIGVPIDMEKAISLFKQASEQGSADASYELGFRYLHGHGVTVDHGEGYAWLERSNKQKRTGKCLFLLGKCHEKGYGVPKSGSLAQLYYNQAMKKGYHVDPHLL